jgi:single-stranded-DNA-specific exonuclease
MGSAKRAVELLCETDILKALKIANEIDELNATRQRTEKEIFVQAVEKIENQKMYNARIIVVSGENWHHGVVGIVASRICERYGTPCIVLSSDGDTSHGSGRSFKGISLFDAVSSCKDLTLKFGGHDLACGLTILNSNIDAFRQAINSYVYTLPYNPPVLQLDCKLNPRALSTDLSDSLKQLEPFGFHNQLPIFALFGVTLQRITPLSNNKHLKLLFSKDTNSFQAVIFGVSTDTFCFSVGDVLDLAVTLETNIYNDRKNLSIQIKGIRVSNTDDDKLFNQLENYKLFCKDLDFDAQVITPTREEVGEIYRYVTESGVLADKISYAFINTLGIGKTLSSLAVLEDLGLIYKKDGKYFKNKTTQKTNLANSAIYNKLLKGC